MMRVKAPSNHRVRRELEKRAPKLVETGKKTLILNGTKTSDVLNSVLTEIYHLKRDDSVKYSRKNENIRPFESGGETSLEFFSLKTDCCLFVVYSKSIIVYFSFCVCSCMSLQNVGLVPGTPVISVWLLKLYGSHAKKRPNNLVIGRTYDHHIYDLVEVGIDNFRSMKSFSYDKKLAPLIGTKPFFAFIGEGFENVDELKHLKEVLLDLFRGEVVTNLNLTGLDRVFVCTAISSKKVFFTHCALRLKKSGTQVPKMELVEVGPSMDMVIRRNRLPDESMKKSAMKTAPQLHKKKEKNVSKDSITGKIGKIYIPDQKVGEVPLANMPKGVKRERREAKLFKAEGEKFTQKKQKLDSE